MREAINNSLIFTLVIVFLFLFVILFAGSTAYTKAFKVKNRIISIIERHADLIVNSNVGVKETVVQNEINATLKDAGYRIVNNNDQKCEDALKKRFENTNKTYTPVYNGAGYRYCIAKFYESSAAMKSEYYAVITYMYFEIPLIGAHLEFPVYGETKTLGSLY